MLDAVRAFFARTSAPAPQDAGARGDVHAIRVAACALLLELAHADGEFSDVERERIEAALGRHFGLDATATRELLALAGEARRRSIDHFQFTRLINEGFDLGQKMVLAEVMWSVILADGQFADHEAYLVRKLANLLHLEPAYLSQARNAATPKEPEATDAPPSGA